MSILKIVHHRDSLNLTVEQQSWIGSSPSFGGFVGSLVSGLTSNSLGARRGLLLSSIISCLGWLLIFLAGFLSLLGPIFPGVFLIGFSSGFSNPLTTVYVSETVGSGNKGVVTSLFNCQVKVKLKVLNEFLKDRFFSFSRPLSESWQLMSLACYWVGFTTAWPWVCSIVDSVLPHSLFYQPLHMNWSEPDTLNV